MKDINKNTVYSRLTTTLGTVLLAAVVTVGCASNTPPPTAQFEVAKAAITAAVTAGGSEFAPVELKSAQDKLDAANKAAVTKDYINARRLAEEAQVDAQLATAKARAAQSQKAVEAVQETNRVLREELNRKTE
ncbi:MAG: DUF4398 domain-containing protein [Pseudomonadota bacterium]